MPRAAKVLAPIGCAGLVWALASCGSTRDVVGESHDVHQAAGADAGTPAEGYVHVARRPHGAIGLAEARGLPDAVASAAVERLADELEACTADLRKKGQLVEGAVRVVAQLGPDGLVNGLNLKLAPGAGVAANALLCVVTPLKLHAFPLADADAGARGIAIEATWSP